MSIYTKESLEALRQRVVLPDLLGSFLELKRAGAAYKSLCPFHDEKTPSFTIQKGDSHYHCFGCGAHGDAIAFLMNYQKLSFPDAVEFLADKFRVHLEKQETEETKGPSKKEMREALELATRIYHTVLLHTEEGEQALKYLFNRGISLEFIQHFEVGYAHLNVLGPLLKARGISEEAAEACGLKKGAYDFFQDRILFPIRSPTGFVIGFSGRKIKEETYGGKYVNTPETPLFKKSKVLFGLNYSRQRIAKERVALIVEGQIDALQLIYQGLDFTVAGQGTAFGESHVEALTQLGIQTAYLAFDSDKAGMGAAAKVGNLFQKGGVEAKIVPLPPQYDPDLYLKEFGAAAFLKLLENSEDYLPFLLRHYSLEVNIQSPAGKNELASLLSKQIRDWNHPLMVHESLKKLAQLLKVPESLVGVGQLEVSNIYLKRVEYAGMCQVDSDRVIETDVLRWLLKGSPSLPSLIALADQNLSPHSFKVPICQKVFEIFTQAAKSNKPLDTLDLLCQLEEGEGQPLLEEIASKKIALDKGENHFVEALQKLLDRNWMMERERIRIQVQSGEYTDDEALEFAKKFSISPKKVMLCTST